MESIVWRTAASEPLVLEAGKAYYETVSIQVEPGTGSVELQLWSLTADDWYTPAAAEYTIAVQDAFAIERRNRPPLRIVATGDASFASFGEER